MALHDYLVTEVALDHVEGHLSRRDALTRLGLMGLSLTGAAALLSACGADDPAPSAGSPAPSQAARPSASPAVTGVGYDVAQALARTEPVSFPGDGGSVLGAFATPDGAPKGAVLVVHENRGLTDHIRAVAGRLAGDGYAALAVDLISRKGGTPAVDDATAALNALSEVELISDLQSGLDELNLRAPDAATGAIGFCFGGGMLWRLLTAGAPGLAAAIPFYGPLPSALDFTGTKAAVLGVFAEQDDRVNAGLGEAEKALTAAGLTHELKVVPGVDHAFFNDTGPRYNAAAAAGIYADVLDWFGTYLA